jgi:autotransporter-associated beta strand protein
MFLDLDREMFATGRSAPSHRFWLPRLIVRVFACLAAVLFALSPPAWADSISAVLLPSGQLQIGLGTSDDNSAVATTTDQANDIFVGGSGMGNTIFGPVTSISVTFQGSGQLFALENNPLPFSSSLTSPILINSSGFGLSNEVLDDTTTGGNVFDFSGFTDPVGRLTSEGNPGTAPLTILSSKGANFVLSDGALVTGASTVELLNVRTAIITHTTGFHEFNSAGWTGNLSLTNNAGAALAMTNAVDYANVTNAGALVFDYANSSITNVGGTGVAGSNPQFGPAGNGGAALTFAEAGSLTTVAGKSITGGIGGTPTIQGDGGNGGNGVVFSTNGSLVNSAGGSISGGAGGAAEANGQGGSGGAGVVFEEAGSLTNAAGATISGGQGGENAISSGGFGPAGLGVSFAGGAGNLTNAGTINGGVAMGNFANNVTLLSGGIINGELLINADPGSTLTLGGAGNQNLSGAVTGTMTFNGALIKQGTGTWTLDYILGYSGGTTLEGGNLQIFSPSVLGAGEIRFTGGTLRYGTGTTADLSSQFSNAADQLYSVDTNGNNVAFATALTSSGGSLTKRGDGTLTLSAANTYSAGTTLQGGILQAANAGALGAGPITFAGGTLQYGAGITQDFSSQFSAASGQLYSIDTNGNNVTFASGLASSGASLNKLGAGTLVLTGFAPLTGSTTISGGNLQVGSVSGSFNSVTLIGTAGASGGDVGGTGGTGVVVTPGATLNLVNGSITGGAGGSGANQGGTGGVGVSFLGAADFVNPTTGMIQGGNAVVGFAYGGTAVVLKAGGSLTNQTGAVITGGSTPQGYGGTGVLFETGGSLINQTGALIAGGSTPEGYGGSGVVFTGGTGTLVNAGTITGGNESVPGYGGTGVLFTGTTGNLTNSGTINGGVTMDNFANAVTLLSGGVINGDLNLGGNAGSTLTLAGSGDQTYSAAVTGTTTLGGALIKQGSGKWTLDQALNFAGGTTLQSGVLEAANAAVLGSGLIRFTGGTLRYGSGLTQDFSAQFSTAANQSFLIDTNNNDVTFGTALTSSGGSLTKLGEGSLVLTGNNTVGGALLSAGQLQIGTLTTASTLTGAASTGPGGTAGTGVEAASGTVLNLLNGSIMGGAGWSSSQGASNGGTGVSLASNAVFATTAGASVVGGDGGNGGNLANGGDGGAGVVLGGGATFTGSANMIVSGGSGGAGATLAITTGGQGGAGIIVGSGATFVSANGSQITGGSGGHSPFTGGNGGVGVSFLGNATFVNATAATIQGGAATDGFANGGAGAIFQAGGSLTNQAGALIAGGATPFGIGGAGVAFLAGGSLTNDAGAIITGGSGSGEGGGNGFGVSISGGAGNLSNAGTINGGVSMGNFANTVTLFNGGTISGDLNMSNNGGTALTLDGSGNQTFSAAVTGTTTFAGSLIKEGVGTWTVDRSLYPTGGTTINQGRFNLTSTLGGNVYVAAGASLTGNGRILGDINLVGTHSPGNSPGIQSVGGNLTYSGGASTVEWELEANAIGIRGTTYDGIDVGGNLVFAGTTILVLDFAVDVDWTNPFWSTDKLGTDGWLIYDVTGLTTSFANLGLSASSTWLDKDGVLLSTERAGASFALYQDGSDIFLNYTAIPEPSAMALISLTLLAFAFARRRRAHGAG